MVDKSAVLLKIVDQTNNLLQQVEYLSVGQIKTLLAGLGSQRAKL